MQLNLAKGARFEAFRQALSEEELHRFQQRMLQEGFAGFRIFLEGFKLAIRTYTEQESAEMAGLVAKARGLFPQPEQFSPAWQTVWEEYGDTVKYKSEVLAAISPEERDGEWQVLLDNPYTNQGIVCYPALAFSEAAYMYAYFRTGLNKNEYIRLQKIQTMLMTYGGEQGK